MSTEQHSPRMDLASNAPDLISQLDVITTDDAEPDADAGDEDVPESKSSQRGKMEPPPSSSRDLGGRCPRCGSFMETRLRARYHDTDSAALIMYGDCTGACGLTVESDSVADFTLTQPNY